MSQWLRSLFLISSASCWILSHANAISSTVQDRKNSWSLMGNERYINHTFSLSLLNMIPGRKNLFCLNGWPKQQSIRLLATQGGESTLDSPSEIKSRAESWSWQLFVLLLKHWPFLWEACGREAKKKGRGGFAVHSHVEAQSSNNLSQPALASYGLWNPAKTFMEQDYSLHLSFSDCSSLCFCLLTNSLPVTLLCPQF